MRDYFLDQIRAAEKHYTRALKKDSVKDIYQLRVAIRRLRMILQLLKTNKAKTLKASELKSVNRIWKALGKLRDLDVALENAHAFGLDTTMLKRERKKAYPKILSKLKTGKLDVIIKSLEKLSKKITDEDLKPKSLARKLLKDLDRKYSSITDLHELRIVLKKTRYLLESLEVPITQFKIYQTVLGELNDLENLLHTFKKDKAVTAAKERKLALAKKIVGPAQKLAIKKLSALP